MNIVVDGFVYQYQSYGGISRIYNEILPRMCDLDSSSHFEILMTNRSMQALPTHSRIQHHYLLPVERILRPGRLWWPIIPQIRALVQQGWEKNTNGGVWHSTYYTIPKKWAGPVIVTVYDMIHERFVDSFTGLRNDLLRNQKLRSVLAADMVICISNTTRQDVQQTYGLAASKIQVIPLAHNTLFKVLKDVDYSKDLPTSKPFFLYIGDRSSCYKNFGILLEAYSSWFRNKEMDLVIVGKQWSVDEIRHLANISLSDQIHLLTDISDQTLCVLYNQATAFVYPSLYEGFGIPLLEAMACGCPVIASRIPSTIEVAGEYPIYFEPTLIDSLLAALDTALLEGRNSTRVRAGLKWAERYSWNKTARQTLEVYYSV